MSKKKLIFLLSIFLIFIGMASTTLNAKATNPEHLDILYDQDTDHLSLFVVHGVTHEEFHYISLVKMLSY